MATHPSGGSPGGLYTRSKPATGRSATRDVSGARKLALEEYNPAPPESDSVAKAMEMSASTGAAGGAVPVGNPIALQRLGMSAGARPLHIISIIGSARGGKSTLLNLLSGKLRAFEVDAGITSLTKGVDALVEALPSVGDFARLHDTTVGRSACATDAVTFMDGEGGGVKGNKYDVKLYTPVLLMSKAVIVNWKGSLQVRTIVEQLSVLREAASRVAAKAARASGVTGGGPRSEKPDALFGHLHLIMRDFENEVRDPETGYTEAIDVFTTPTYAGEVVRDTYLGLSADPTRTLNFIADEIEAGGSNIDPHAFRLEYEEQVRHEGVRTALYESFKDITVWLLPHPRHRAFVGIVKQIGAALAQQCAASPPRMAGMGDTIITGRNIQHAMASVIEATAKERIDITSLWESLKQAEASEIVREAVTALRAELFGALTVDVAPTDADSGAAHLVNKSVDAVTAALLAANVPKLTYDDAIAAFKSQYEGVAVVALQQHRVATAAIVAKVQEIACVGATAAAADWAASHVAAEAAEVSYALDAAWSDAVRATSCTFPGWVFGHVLRHSQPAEWTCARERVLRALEEMRTASSLVAVHEAQETAKAEQRKRERAEAELREAQRRAEQAEAAVKEARKEAAAAETRRLEREREHMLESEAHLLAATVAPAVAILASRPPATHVVMSPPAVALHDDTDDQIGGKFYKGGQFMPGGGRAPAGGAYAPAPAPSYHAPAPESTPLYSTWSSYPSGGGGSSGGTFYKGGQFMPGGGRAPAGGAYASAPAPSYHAPAPDSTPLYSTWSSYPSGGGESGGTFYKGGQFMPGGGRAPKGGAFG